MGRRSRFAWYGSAGMLVVLGIAAAVELTGTAGQVLAFVLIALGLVLVTSLIFLEVGLSEDRDRAREDDRARNEKAASRSRFARPSLRQEPDRQSPGKLDRSRGRRRRLR
jgi:hypothetical protein